MLLRSVSFTNKVMNSLHIRGIKQKFKIGCTAEERAWPQLLTIDIQVWFSMENSIKSDSLHDTVDYVAMIGLVESLAGEYEWSLVEKLSADIGKSTKAKWPVIEKIAKRISDKCDDSVCEVVS